jgi:D-galactarolactone cycloisomerase
MSDHPSRIVRIEGFELACDMPHIAGNALRVFSQRAALLVRLTSASGHVGWGETHAFPKPAAAMIRGSLARRVLGADARAPVALQSDLLSMIVPDRRGQAHMAISAIDIACWDLWGRIEGKPLSALLGGALRNRVRAYASGPLLVAGPDRYLGFEAAIESYARAGFNAVKLRVGISPREDERAIRAARAILGDDAMLMIDLNEASTVHQAVALVDSVADCRLSWIEEPLAHDDLPGYRRLADRLPIPLAGGESFCGVQAFRDSLATGALDLIQPDIALCGGLTEAMRIAGLADAFNAPVAPHVWGTGVNMLVALQYCAMLTPRSRALPMPLFEYDMSPNLLRDAIWDRLPDADGMLAVPDGPGLGREIAPDRIEPFVTEHWVVECD